MTDRRSSLRGVAVALRRGGSREVLFLVSVWLKGLDALLEIIGGTALFSVSPVLILRVVRLLTQDEIAEDPRDLVANALRHTAGRITFASEHSWRFICWSTGRSSLSWSGRCSRASSSRIPCRS